MRCSCTQCGTYMTHAESMHLGCVCPNCLNRCTACLGTNSVIGKDDLDRLRDVARAIELKPFDAPESDRYEESDKPPI